MEKPAWFEAALAMEPRDHWITVNGARIHYLSWGEPGGIPLMLNHGGTAHAKWWAFLAPLLAERHHIVAPDFSGHGDSDHRELYSPLQWAEEACAVVDDAGMDQPVLIGHSMGGLISATTYGLHGHRFSGLIAVDAPIERPKPPKEGQTRQLGSLDPYPTLEEAVARFRLMPVQPAAPDYIMDYIARNSLREVDGGWQWKFDSNIFRHFKRTLVKNSYYTNVTGRFVFIRGEHSTLAKDEGKASLMEQIGREIPFITIPEAHHHLILDQPLAFISAVRTILELWDW